MAEFQVGDQVTHEDGSPGEVKYGPYPHPDSGVSMYLVRYEPGQYMETYEGRLTHRPAFKVGDAALFEDGPTEIVGGPFTDSDGTVWYAHTQRGEHRMSTPRALSPIPSPAPLKVGDRIRVLEDWDADTDVRAGQAHLLAADAAMAVADEEFSAAFARNTKLLAENASLREELSYASDQAAEVATLRAELEQTADAAMWNTVQAETALATISRVRAAAQRAKDSGNVWDLEDLISAALDGTNG